MRNSIEFQVSGKYALFTDPLTKIGREKSTYHVPTPEALKGICRSIYWKPTITWVVDSVRVMKRISTYPKGVKPLRLNGSKELAVYTYLTDVKYQVKAHFEWNLVQIEMKDDRIEGKHLAQVEHALVRGGRKTVFLGTRECLADVQPCEFGSGEGFYDNVPLIEPGLMFQSFKYPSETGKGELIACFAEPQMKHGVIEFCHPDDYPEDFQHFIRPMAVEVFPNHRKEG